MPFFICSNEVKIAKAFEYAGLTLPSCDTLWTDERTLLAYKLLSDLLGYMPDAYLNFRRIGECGVHGESQRLAGHTLILGRRVSSPDREELYHTCLRMPEFSRVRYGVLAPRWVECSVDASFSELRMGDVSVYVFVLQDALIKKGMRGIALSGVFDIATERALRRLDVGYSGTVTHTLWRRLLK